MAVRWVLLLVPPRSNTARVDAYAAANSDLLHVKGSVGTVAVALLDVDGMGGAAIPVDRRRREVVSTDINRLVVKMGKPTKQITCVWCDERARMAARGARVVLCVLCVVRESAIRNLLSGRLQEKDDLVGAGGGAGGERRAAVAPPSHCAPCSCVDKARRAEVSGATAATYRQHRLRGASCWRPTTLVSQGPLRVAVLEAGELRGRAQDWNASRKEVMELVEAGVLSRMRSTRSSASSSTRCAAAFRRRGCVAQRRPQRGRASRSAHRARARALRGGGRRGAREDAAQGDPRPSGCGGAHDCRRIEIRTRLVIDCMGQRSPIVAQVREARAARRRVCRGGLVRRRVRARDEHLWRRHLCRHEDDAAARRGRLPDAIFLGGVPASASPTQRTTYLFTYMDLDPARPSVMDIMEDYWKLLPGYQGVEPRPDRAQARALRPVHLLQGLAPPVKFDRIMQIGDAGGLQSPLSFGGFGAITRHIGRLTAGGRGRAGGGRPAQRRALDGQSLSGQPARGVALPGLDAPAGDAGAWSDDFISKVLVATFEVMEERGEAVMLPFLQDTLRVDGLALTIGGLMLSSPVVAVEILVRLGPVPLADCASTRASNSAALHPRARSCPASNAICLDDICLDRSTSRSDSRWRRVCPFCCDVPRIGTRLRAEPLARESGGAPAARAGTLRHRPVRRGLAVRQWSGLHATRAADADGPAGLGDGEGAPPPPRGRSRPLRRLQRQGRRRDRAGRRASLNVSRRPWRASASYAPRRCVGPFLCVR